MRIQAYLVPLRTRGNVTIVGSYRDRVTDKEVFLLASGKKVVSSLSEGDRVYQHTFEEGMSIPFSFDESNFQEKAVVDFWKNHPLVVTDGYNNPNLITEQFKFEVKAEKVRVEYDELLARLQCVSQVSAMTFQEQINLTFALGSDPRNMDQKEIYLHLIGLTLNGMAIAKKKFVASYLSVRANERIATVYANKAISYGVVSKEGSVYKIAGRNAGTTIDAVVALILSDTELFENYIKPEVDKHDENQLLKYSIDDTIDLPEEIKNLIPASGVAAKKKVTKASE
jgi:hypothetical protein